MVSTDSLEWVNNHHHLLIIRTDKNAQHTVHSTYDMYNLVLMTFCLLNQPNQSRSLYEARMYKLKVYHAT